MIDKWDIELFSNLKLQGASVESLVGGKYLVRRGISTPEDTKMLAKFLRLAQTKGTDYIKVVAGDEIDTYLVTVI